MAAHSRFLLCLLGGASLIFLVLAGCQSSSSLFDAKQLSALSGKPNSGAPAAATPGVSIDQEPVNFATRNFDPAAPPPDMPPLGEGENAECDSNFTADASVGGQPRRVDATHAVLTITQVRIILRLNVTIWVPFNVTQRVLAHEEGHRQISEAYYKYADQVARRIAAEHIGGKVEVSGSDLSAASNEMLQQVAAEITDEYGMQLKPDAAQLLYDRITDHSRADIASSDAVAQALMQDPPDSPPSSGEPGN